MRFRHVLLAAACLVPPLAGGVRPATGQTAAPAEDAVRGMQFHVSAVRPQLCAISHAGLLTLTFTSPFTETDHIREFARRFDCAVRVGDLPDSSLVSVRLADNRRLQGELADINAEISRRIAQIRALAEQVVQGDYTFDDGFRGARRLLALREPPTAIFGSNDEIAAGVLAAAKSAGMNVPYDLSIAGFEDSPFSRQSWPPLTTAKQATEDIARHAARLLIAQLRSDAYDDAPAPLHNQGFVPQLVVRGSTAPMRPAGARPLPSDPA